MGCPLKIHGDCGLALRPQDASILVAWSYQCLGLLFNPYKVLWRSQYVLGFDLGHPCGGLRIYFSSGGSVLGFPYDVSFEYDLAAEDEAGETEASYWLRGSVTPDFAKGAYLLFGYSSEEVLTYGVGYKCNDNMKVITEFSSGEKDADGNDVENDFSIRASYSF